MYEFEDSFDESKSQWTKQHRGIDFIEARAVWDDPEAIEGPGTTKDGEERWLKVGKIDEKLWTVGFTTRVGKIRIFMVRRPHEDEKEAYYG